MEALKSPKFTARDRYLPILPMQHINKYESHGNTHYLLWPEIGGKRQKIELVVPFLGVTVVQEANVIRAIKRRMAMLMAQESEKNLTFEIGTIITQEPDPSEAQGTAHEVVTGGQVGSD